MQKTIKQRKEQLLRQRRWYTRNKERRNLNCRNKYLELRVEALVALGGQCECCSENHPEFLCIDHRNGGGNKDRKAARGRKFLGRIKKEGFPKLLYRVLCHNCNFSHGVLGYCPHQVLALTEDMDKP